jgi:diacylglycerol O-acyltransferase
MEGDMDQLSGIDAQFLHLETSTTVAHVGSLIIIEPIDDEAPITLDELRDVIEPRLPLVRVLRQRVVSGPLAIGPVGISSLGIGPMFWVDDPEFDIEFHLREVGIPSPGNDLQLSEQVSRIHARPLDRSRPLWEMYLIHNLSEGRQAVYAKVHHAAVDGVSGAEVLATIMDVTSEPTAIEPPEDDWKPELPTQTSVLNASLGAIATKPFATAEAVVNALPHLLAIPSVNRLPGIRVVSTALNPLLRLINGASTDAASASRQLDVPRTPLNGTITAHRRFAFGSLPLADLKMVKNTHRMTLNDVVMALCAGALRRWLLDHDGLPEIPLVAAVPVSVRADDQAGTGGNRISIMLAELPTHLPTPAERLNFSQTAMTAAKGEFEAVPATILQDVAAAIPTALAGLASRAAYRMGSAGMLPFNLFISNVPGPQVSLYVAGTRVRGIYPASAISDVSGALNITLFSYDGSVDFGLIACRELIPDVWKIVDYLREELAELLAC